MSKDEGGGRFSDGCRWNEGMGNKVGTDDRELSGVLCAKRSRMRSYVVVLVEKKVRDGGKKLRVMLRSGCEPCLGNLGTSRSGLDLSLCAVARVGWCVVKGKRWFQIGA